MIWQTTTIEEISEVKGGKRLPAGHDFSPDPTNHLYIRARDIGAGKIQCDQPVYISDETHLKIARYTVDEGDVVITIVGANVGDVGYVSDDLVGANLTENAAKLVVDRKRYDPVFLKYFLASRSSKERLAFIASGAAQGKLGLYKIKSFSVPEPPLPVQRNVSSILSAYDDLIENNRRRIALLEEAARLLYREWFVHFRFPGHEHVKIVNDLPEGWVEGKVSDLGLAITGKTPSKKVEANFGDEVPFIKTPDMHGNVFVISAEESLSEQGAKTQSNKTVPIGSIMVSCIGTVGAVAMNASPAQTNQQINTVIPKYQHWQFFGFFALKAIKSRLEAMGGGATMANVNKTKFESVPIILPSDELILSFHEIVKPQFELVEKLACQNIELAKARDLLLPRLMDGRLEV